MEAAAAVNASAFFDALRTGQHAQLQWFLSRSPQLAASRDASGLSAVRTALYYQQPAALQLLLEQHPRQDLHDAAALGDAARIRQLLAGGAQLEELAADGLTALQLAAHFGHTGCIALLIGSGARLENRGADPQQQTPLHHAASQGHLAAARMLLQAGADADARDRHRDTPLHCAARSGSRELVELLLSHGADASLRNADNQTASDVLSGVQYSESL